MEEKEKLETQEKLEKQEMLGRTIVKLFECACFLAAVIGLILHYTMPIYNECTVPKANSEECAHLYACLEYLRCNCTAYDFDYIPPHRAYKCHPNGLAMPIEPFWPVFIIPFIIGLIAWFVFHCKLDSWVQLEARIDYLEHSVATNDGETKVSGIWMQ